MIPQIYPVTLEAPEPARFDRVQVALRLLVLVAIGVLNRTAGGLFGVVYLLLPIVAAILVARGGAVRFLEGDGPWFTGVIRWLVALYAYLLFVTDRFPLEAGTLPIRLVVRRSGSPTVGSALLRLITSIPHVVILAFLGLASGLIAIVLAFTVLVRETCPSGLHAFQRDVIGWMARLLAYHASLVEQYPPFSLGPVGAPPTAGDTHAAPTG